MGYAHYYSYKWGRKGMKSSHLNSKTLLFFKLSISVLFFPHPLNLGIDACALLRDHAGYIKIGDARVYMTLHKGTSLQTYKFNEMLLTVTRMLVEMFGYQFDTMGDTYLIVLDEAAPLLLGKCNVCRESLNTNVVNFVFASFRIMTPK